MAIPPTTQTSDEPLVINRKWYEGARINLAFAVGILVAVAYFVFDLGAKYGTQNERLDDIEEDLVDFQRAVEDTQKEAAAVLEELDDRLRVVEIRQAQQ